MTTAEPTATETPVIRTLLVANRGEIACRIFRTCRELGITTVAVHSDPDAGALHVRAADLAVRLPGAAPADTYLRADLLVAAALAAGADAVHPGYGFLAENAGFARAVTAAGLLWVGPPAAAVAAMASKPRAKELAGEKTGAAAAPAFPLLVKAAAGGGGRGMRIVRDPADLPAALTAARAEAAAAFGDDEVFTEPYIERARHVEVQILADAHGTVWTLGTRDCSLQRRHQKVVEESPAPHLPPGLAGRLQQASARMARAVGYTGAGTAEFLVTPSGEPHFLEMNTRLQVEHPVTEEVHGLDLVAWQLRIAEGARLPAEPPPARGHAVEARLYAEDPARHWAPGGGLLHRLSVPTGPGLRIDTGYADGDTVPVHYDALLAKVVAWAPTRAEALRRLASALERSRVHGPVTNLELLIRSLRHPKTAAGRADTTFYERHLSELVSAAPDPYAPVAAALADAARSGARSRFGGWRNLPSQPQSRRYRTDADGAEHEIRYHHTRDGLTVERAPGEPAVLVVAAGPDAVVLETGGVRRRYDTARHGDRVYAGATALTALPRFAGPAERHEPGSLLAPMPGTVARVSDGLAVGDRVVRGQPLLWLEAMKMEHRVAAPADGVLTALHAAAGRTVERGALLAVVQVPGEQATGNPAPGHPTTGVPDAAHEGAEHSAQHSAQHSARIGATPAVSRPEPEERPS
ncbi:ATP-binding protein [Streptomyces yaizuensis]|uniref:Acetyl/propionyl-CoA carboxylase subunit alpha n=1 Tax=Streptomyces yaizuensis TaxID=2989713 RepID=A0ABQ5P3Z2_9ACTN|nr:biotin carboxylase N-terminal domain-containing protein [Streptomyces sp. YSPA8]GLF97304.1 acetyl/propionyl-CoA carboxylase subunit alpha [Streptomyces sp. YSPA8]